MQDRILTLLFLLIFTTHATSAEEYMIEGSTYTLDSIDVLGHTEHKISDFHGGNVFQADSLILHTQNNRSIADFIAQHTPYVVKQNGNGMMTTLSLRGTSASHTQAIWEEINISPLTMGQTDYSILPLYFFDNMEIFPGGESAVFGSGAIGGAVTLSSPKKFEKRRIVSLQQDLGSFGLTFSGIKLNMGNNKVQNNTSLFFNRCENNFPTQFRGETLRQKNAQYMNYGILNETDIKLNDRHLIGGKVWFSRHDRELQPMLQNNDDPSKYEKIDDQSVKVVVNHEFSGDKIHFRNKIAWINDREHFKEDLIATHDLMFLSNVRKKIKKLTLEAGGDVHYIKPEVYAYKANTEEWRGSIFLLSKFNPNQWISLHGNVRQSFASQLSIPISPAFGFDTKLIKKEHFTWAIGGNIARNTKIPTLNDRYWGDYANKDLLSETAFNLEAKSNWRITHNHYLFHMGATLYRNDVDNWIMWMPRGVVWKPTNIQEVLARGVETEMSHQFPIGKTHHKIAILYNHSFTEIKKGFAEMHPFTGHQTPLTPKNTAAGNWIVTYKESGLTISGNYTGERTSSDIYDILEGYLLWDISLNHTFTFPKKRASNHTQRLTLSFQVKNLLDKTYQNLPFRGMPGRNFAAGIKWQIAAKP